MAGTAHACGDRSRAAADEAVAYSFRDLLSSTQGSAPSEGDDPAFGGGAQPAAPWSAPGSPEFDADGPSTPPREAPPEVQRCGPGQPGGYGHPIAATRERPWKPRGTTALAHTEAVKSELALALARRRSVVEGDGVQFVHPPGASVADFHCRGDDSQALIRSSCARHDEAPQARRVSEVDDDGEQFVDSPGAPAAGLHRGGDYSQTLTRPSFAHDDGALWARLPRAGVERREDRSAHGFSWTPSEDHSRETERHGPEPPAMASGLGLTLPCLVLQEVPPPGAHAQLSPATDLGLGLTLPCLVPQEVPPPGAHAQLPPATELGQTAQVRRCRRALNAPGSPSVRFSFSEAGSEESLPEAGAGRKPMRGAAPAQEARRCPWIRAAPCRAYWLRRCLHGWSGIASKKSVVDVFIGTMDQSRSGEALEHSVDIYELLATSEGNYADGVADHLSRYWSPQELEAAMSTANGSAASGSGDNDSPRGFQVIPFIPGFASHDDEEEVATTVSMSPCASTLSVSLRASSCLLATIHEVLAAPSASSSSSMCCSSPDNDRSATYAEGSNGASPRTPFAMSGVDEFEALIGSTIDCASQESMVVNLGAGTDASDGVAADDADDAARKPALIEVPVEVVRRRVVVPVEVVGSSSRALPAASGEVKAQPPAGAAWHPCVLRSTTGHMLPHPPLLLRKVDSRVVRVGENGAPLWEIPVPRLHAPRPPLQYLSRQGDLTPQMPS